jgi:hypothetical protein
VLAPGRPDDLIQLIDARDMGSWMISMLERPVTGTFHAAECPPPFGQGDTAAPFKFAASTAAAFAAGLNPRPLAQTIAEMRAEDREPFTGPPGLDIPAAQGAATLQRWVISVEDWTLIRRLVADGFRKRRAAFVPTKSRSRSSMSSFRALPLGSWVCHRPSRDRSSLTEVKEPRRMAWRAMIEKKLHEVQPGAPGRAKCRVIRWFSGAGQPRADLGVLVGFDHRRLGAAHPLRDLRPGQPLSRQQHDPGPPHHPGRGATVPHPPLQLHPVRIAHR